MEGKRGRRGFAEKRQGNGGGSGGAHGGDFDRILRQGQGDVVEGRVDVVGAGVAVFGLFAQELLNDGVKRGALREIRGHVRGHRTEVLVQEFHVILPGEGRLAHEHLVEDDAAGVEIGAVIDLVADDLLRGDVLRRSVDLTGLREGAHVPVAVFVMGDAKIEQFDDVVDAVAGDEKNVVGLDVAVDDALVADALEGAEELAHDADGIDGLESARALQACAERFAFEKLHDEVEVAGFEDVKVDDGADVGVFQRGRGLRLAAEPLDDLFVSGRLAVQDFDGHRSVHELVFGPVNRAHGAAAHLATDTVFSGDDVAWLVRIHPLSSVEPFACGGNGAAITTSSPQKKPVSGRHGSRENRLWRALNRWTWIKVCGIYTYMSSGRNLAGACASSGCVCLAFTKGWSVIEPAVDGQPADVCACAKKEGMSFFRANGRHIKVF